jgi:hypothetical protein
MTVDENVTKVSEQIKVAKDNAEVEMIIQVSIAGMKERDKNEFVLQQYLDKLRIKIGGISPLNCSSNQWSCYRFALICIRNASITYITEDLNKNS